MTLPFTPKTKVVVNADGLHQVICLETGEVIENAKRETIVEKSKRIHDRVINDEIDFFKDILDLLDTDGINAKAKVKTILERKIRRLEAMIK